MHVQNEKKYNKDATRSARGIIVVSVVVVVIVVDIAYAACSSSSSDATARVICVTDLSVDCTHARVRGANILPLLLFFFRRSHTHYFFFTLYFHARLCAKKCAPACARELL